LKHTTRSERHGIVASAVRQSREQTGMKVRDILKLIEEDGWRLVETKGSHRQYMHPTKPGRVTIAGHLNDDLAPGTLNSIIKQAHLK
jgi:predicted RNA binding protein YcfA (HicA-like mRNA interferase family)